MRRRVLAVGLAVAALSAILTSCGTAQNLYELEAGTTFSCALTTGGQVVCWGANDQGQLGTGVGAASSSPVTVPGVAGIQQVVTGGLHACARSTGGTVLCWGDNGQGQVGDNSTDDAPVATPVLGLSGVRELAAGAEHTCAVLDDDTVTCWGSNDHGQLGSSVGPSSPVPVAVTGLQGVSSIAAGVDHTCAVLQDGTARCWGADSRGQLGDGQTNDSSAPVVVSALASIRSIVAGSAHSCALTTTNEVRCWGANDHGQLGDGSQTDSPTPVAPVGVSGLAFIDAGEQHTCAGSTAGTVWCWGDNRRGQAAQPAVSQVLTPLPVSGLTNVTDLALGRAHTCARLNPVGEARCWGANDEGQLGNASLISSSTPVVVAGITDPVLISGGLPEFLTVGVPLDAVAFRAVRSFDTSLSLTDGAIPDGLSIVQTGPTEMTLTGTPTNEGDFSFTLTATGGGRPPAVRTISGYVGTRPTVTRSIPASVAVRSVVRVQLEASGTSPVWWSVEPDVGTGLPAGLSLSDDGLLTGTPTTLGTSSGVLTVQSFFGSDTVPFTITVSPPVLTTLVGPGPSSGPALTVASPSVNGAAGLALDGDQLYVSNDEVPTVRRVDLSSGTQTLVAGDYIRRTTPLPAPATSSSFRNPGGGAIGPDGALYFATSTDNRVLRLGNDGQLSVYASISLPTDVVFDGPGNAYVYSIPGRIYRIPAGGGTPVVVAGDGSCGFSGLNGPATAARICANNRLTVGPDGSLWFDQGSIGNVLMRITPDGIFRVGAQPPAGVVGMVSALTFGPDGKLYVAYGNQLYRWDGNAFERLAGLLNAGSAFAGDGGPALDARFDRIVDLEVGADGAVYALDYGNYRVRRIIPGGNVTTVVGNGFKHTSGDGGPATSAQVMEAFGATYDAVGNLYFSDRQGRVVRKVDTSGVISTVAGNGKSCFNPETCVLNDGQPAVASSLATPEGLAVGNTGDLYIVDQVGLVWRLGGDGILRRFAGGGTGAGTFSGDGGPATSARFANPRDVAISPSGDVYIADYFNNRVRKVNAAGVINTVAGTGPDGFSGGFGGDGGSAANAQLNLPVGLAFDASGNLYIADLMNHRIRKVTPAGTIVTVAGNGAASFAGDGGPAVQASLNRPYDVAIGAGGELYIADYNNKRVRRVSPSGTMSTVAGNGSPGFNGDGGLATASSIDGAQCVAVSPSGSLAVCDTLNWRIRGVTPP